ncbi:hypothetical protein [Nocardioides pacificus]
MSTEPTNRPTDRSFGRPTGRHPVDVGHLVMGLAFLGLVGVWALWVNDAVPGDDLRFLLPLPWVLGGAAGLLAMAISAARRNRRGSEAPVAAPAPHDTYASTPYDTDDTDDTEEIR